MKDAELMKNIEEKLLQYIPKVKGECVSADLYLLTNILPTAVSYVTLSDNALKKIKQVVKENPVFERPEVKEEFDYYFEKLGIIEKKKE